jgi:hypothetical protein
MNAEEATIAKNALELISALFAAFAFFVPR